MKFICIIKESKKEELLKNGFKLICEQSRNGFTVYTFSFNPSFYAKFNNDNEIFISNRMTMA